jgi:hypothetical protein
MKIKFGESIACTLMHTMLARKRIKRKYLVDTDKIKKQFP